MSSRSSHLRTKVVALLVSMTALWAFAAFITVREGLNLLGVATLDANVGKPSEAVVDALQLERRSTVALLAGKRTAAEVADLTKQRAATDDAVARFRRLSTSTSAELAASGDLTDRIEGALRQLDELAGIRSVIDANRMERPAAIEIYTALIDGHFRIYHALATVDDKEVAREGRTIVALFQSREILSQEDALVTGARAEGEFSGSEFSDFVQLVGTQRFLQAQAGDELPEAGQVRYQKMVDSSAYLRFRAVENGIIDSGRPGRTLPAVVQDWPKNIDPVFAQLRELVLAGTDDTVAHARPAAAWVIVRLVLAGGLGLLAVVASVVVSITTARSLMRQLERLRTAAWELANDRLPRLVTRLSHGEAVDIAAEAPPLRIGGDEIGQLSEAFNAAQQTAISVAVEQAELRRSVRDIFLSLARRTQALVHRQLTLLDAMERRENDAEELEDLFRIDHLATRMRRNAENLIVLSGATPGRAWRRTVPMIDVIRGAVAEVEDYARVTVLPVGSTGLTGRAVGDVIHLLAELIENAVSFSPPYTMVQVSGQMVANGFAIEIEDRGLGMSDLDLAAANEQIANPPEFTLSSTARLGLYVVSRLAERHDIRVQLKDSPYGGTTAVVLIPPALVVGGTSPGELRRPGPTPRGQIPGGPARRDLAARELGRDLAARELGRGADRRASAGPPAAEPEVVQLPAAEPAAGPDARIPAAGPDVRPPEPSGPAGAAPAPLATGVEPTGVDLDAATTQEINLPVLGFAGGSEQVAAATLDAIGTSAPPARPAGTSAPPARPAGTALPSERPAVTVPVVPAAPVPDGLFPEISTVEPASEGPEPVAGAPEPASSSPAPRLAGLLGRPRRLAGDLDAAPDGQPEQPAGAPGAPIPVPYGDPVPAAPRVTPSGLPLRVRQASLAPQLRSVPQPAPAPQTNEETLRSPEEIRRIMGSYQSGTLRGRSAAAELMGGPSTAGEPAPGPAGSPAPGPGAPERTVGGAAPGEPSDSEPAGRDARVEQHDD